MLHRKIRELPTMEPISMFSPTPLNFAVLISIFVCCFRPNVSELVLVSPPLTY